MSQRPLRPRCFRNGTFFLMARPPLLTRRGKSARTATFCAKPNKSVSLLLSNGSGGSVPRKNRQDFPIGMEKVYRLLESWRRRRHGRSPIPQPLWVAAATVAQHRSSNDHVRLASRFEQLDRIAVGIFQL